MNADVAAEAEEYLRAAGLQEGEIRALQRSLGGETESSPWVWYFVFGALGGVAGVLILRRRNRTR